MRTSLLLLFLIVQSNLIAQELTIDQKADSLLDLMTLDEKIGQMAQAERGALENISDIAIYNLGSLLSGGGSAPEINNVAEWSKMYDTYQTEALKTRLKIPLIYGIDAVHGHNNVYGAVIFPHNIGLGCTRNPELIEQINQITAKEVAATGIDWTFSPCIAVPKNEQWGRTYEGFGETAELQKMMAAASVKGLQGTSLSDPSSILACAKHYVGDGGTIDGIDQGNTLLSEEELRTLHMQGYIDAIDNQVGSIMASYNSWNGQKLHGQDYLLTTVLKDELGFEGFIVSDWKGVDQIDEDYRESVKRAINAGIDMVMVPDRYIYFISVLKDLVLNNEVSTDRVDDAVRRILKQKFLLDLFEYPFTDKSMAAEVGSEAHRTVAKQAVRESMVLLASKNNVLPLQKDGQKILVAGRLANDIGAQCGGWSISWQGKNGNITEGTTILEGLQATSGSSSIIYSQSGDSNEDVDVAVLVIGEDPYAEGAGDKTNLNLEKTDIELAESLKERGIPVIVILISGRPMIIGEMLPFTDAFFAAWLPGTEATGIAEILFGDYQPSGELSHTWPKHMGQIPINYGDTDYDPLFPYRFGLAAFPNDENNTLLKPIAAKITNNGSQVILALNRTVSFFEPQVTDFSLLMAGIPVSGISDVNLNDHDNSIIVIDLAEPITTTENHFTLSYSGSGIQASEAGLDNFMDYYVHNASIPMGSPIGVPGRIEAEDYFAMSGVATEVTEDIGGGENVGWIAGGDWMEYNIIVNETGDYEIKARISGFVDGQINFDFNNGTVANLNYTSTAGWQNWQYFKTSVSLVAGQYQMRVNATKDGFNINYYDFGLSDAVLGVELNSIPEIAVYPNPIESSFTLEFDRKSSEKLLIAIYDMSGILVSKLYEGVPKTTQFKQKFLLKDEVKPGIYFLEIRDNDRRYFKKLMIK